MTAITFAPASREQARARIGIQGPAGSGKTKTALVVGEALAQGGQVGLVDTERGSALTYAPVPGRPELGGHEFLHLPMDTHDPRSLIEVVREAERIKLPVLIVDSWSHFWNGRGGLLEIVERAGSEKGAGGTFGGWRTGNPIEQDMLDALLNFSGHLIVTMRTKGDYVIEGKKVTKVGVKAVQREGAEYELGLILDMVEGTATITKTRYSPLEGMTIHHPGEQLAEVILEQLGQGVDPVKVIMDELVKPGLTYQEARELHERARRRQLLAAGVLDPATGAATTLGELIVARGTAAKPAAVPDAPAPGPSPAPPSTPLDPGPAAAEVSGPVQPPTGRATAPQMRMMHLAFNQLGVTDRDERLSATSLIVGRGIPSANDLSKEEAGTLLDSLNLVTQQPEPRAAYDAMLQRLAQSAA
ncbi:AAA family ATPase [Streptomyces tateyamensis]|uniref:AAA family ATPase n=1 Tax=Streptomyces tateyamensis TaxID=565073 RepID=UPI001C646520|nr:AAA family ATPase [Streptomyces tateyamensis]